MTIGTARTGMWHFGDILPMKNKTMSMIDAGCQAEFPAYAFRAIKGVKSARL